MRWLGACRVHIQGTQFFVVSGVCCPMVVTRRLPFGDSTASGCCLLWSSQFLKFSLDLDQHPVHGCVPGSGCSVMETGFVRCP